MSENNIFNRFSIRSQEIFRDNNIDGVIKKLVKQQAQEIELEFVREGYEILSIVRDFLELCAYFRIVFVWSEKDSGCYELIVDPTGYIDSEDRIDLYNGYGKQLCPIAYLGWGGQVMIDEDENLYLFEDGDLDFLGSDLISGIEEIFKGINWRLNPL
jgi:hypothetical protein